VSSRLLLLVTGAALLATGVVVSLATASWVWFGVALAVHAILSGVVVVSALATATQVEKPAPTTVTTLEAEGVSDPEGVLNDLVEQVAGHEEGSALPVHCTTTASRTVTSIIRQRPQAGRAPRPPPANRRRPQSRTDHRASRPTGTNRRRRSVSDGSTGRAECDASEQAPSRCCAARQSA
jgi:membrane protein implicated in regulation of membrane protease activity